MCYLARGLPIEGSFLRILVEPLRNFAVYPTVPVSLGGDTKRRRFLLSGVYVWGNKTTPALALESAVWCMPRPT